MDATPISLGQEFSSYLQTVRKAIERSKRAIHILSELAIGGTAVGTGINTHPEFASKVVQKLSLRLKLPFIEANNHFEAQASRDDCVEVAGLLSSIATALAKIANDIRWMGSGPRSGLGELSLPANQPGSSIMPGKVNPVMSEMLIQVSLYVIGLSQSVTQAGREGFFELNTTLPLMAYCLHESVSTLSNASTVFAQKCILGLKAQ